MKKLILLLLLVTFAGSLAGCGGGSGDITLAPGINGGFPSVVRLLPVHFVAQTNSFITLKTMVIDGNGSPMPGIPVVYTNLSALGVLSKTVETTDGLGIASVTIYSTAPGFATVQVEVNTGSSLIRDQKTVLFSSRSIVDLAPVLTLDVDRDGSFGSPNENSDFNLFENTSDNTVSVRATLSNGLFFLAGNTITFGADRPFKVGTDPAADCSDGSSVCDVIFPDGNVKVTNGFGEAIATVQVVPTTLSPVTTVLNITAKADIGVFNLLSLFLNPVSVDSVTVTANPQIVDSGGTSNVIARATTTAGTPVPDGTTINFTTNQGGIDPFAQTPNNNIPGTAAANFTAPTIAAGGLNVTATVTASVGGKSASTNITVVAPPAPPPPEPPALAINPQFVSTAAGICTTLTFSISGGTPPYAISSSDVSRAFNDNGAGGGIAGNCVRDGSELGIWSGANITVAVPASATAGSVNLFVSDSVGDTDTATITIVP